MRNENDYLSAGNVKSKPESQFESLYARFQKAQMEQQSLICEITNSVYKLSPQLEKSDICEDENAKANNGVINRFTDQCRQFEKNNSSLREIKEFLEATI